MRLFDEHIKRKVVSLDGAWKFRADKNDEGDGADWRLGIPSGVTVTVPHAFSSELGLLNYEGAAWYEKSFYTSGGDLRLCFGAVMTEAKVYLDGEYIGGHYGGFSEFSFIVNNVSKGHHLLTVRCDNRFDSKSIPRRVVDWYHDGGIIRSVSVEELRGVVTLGYKLSYEIDGCVSGRCVKCSLTADMYSTEDTESHLTVSVGHSAFVSATLKMKQGEYRTVTESFELYDIELWDTCSPTLYYIAFNTESDDLIDRVGFRSVEIKGGKLLLNGRSIELLGINRHESHPDFGFAVPATVMKRDLDILERMGANAIRGSHYPNSRMFLDMLDERGILFYSEIPIWGGGFSAESLGDPDVVERGLEMHREMLKYYHNHPSIIIWGMHNEIKSDTEEAYAMTKKYYTYLKEHGGDRIITYATDHPMTDICLEFCDIICINNYTGWYSGEIEEWNAFVEGFERRADDIGVGGKPIVFSEFGAAAIYGNHTFDDIRWTEEYQARLFEHCIELFHANDRVIGFYPWQMCDGRTAKEMGLNRARGYNNKGVLSEYRRPKAAYHTLARLYNSYKR